MFLSPDDRIFLQNLFKMLYSRSFDDDLIREIFRTFSQQIGASYSSFCLFSDGIDINKQNLNSNRLVTRISFIIRYSKVYIMCRFDDYSIDENREFVYIIQSVQSISDILNSLIKSVMVIR